LLHGWELVLFAISMNRGLSANAEDHAEFPDRRVDPLVEADEGLFLQGILGDCLFRS
jgi:hypothetical protein